MKYLIVYSHPNPESFNHAILEKTKDLLGLSGNEVRVRDLYSIGFDPVLKGDDFELIMQGKTPEDVAAEQEYIKWADTVIFIFPIWWTGLPAMVKGYIDRVMLRGFAYDIGEAGPEGLLSDKKAVLINTTGGSEEMYEASGMYNSLRQTIGEGIFGFCGLEITEHKFLSGILFSTDEHRAGLLKELESLVRGL